MNSVMFKELTTNVFAAFLAQAALLVSFLSFNQYSLLAQESLLLFGCAFILAIILGVIAHHGGKFAKATSFSLLLTFLVDYQFPDLVQSSGATLSVLYLMVVFVIFSLFACLIHKAISQVMVTVFTTIILTTLLFPADARPPDFADATKKKIKSSLPPIIHVILDEQIGIEGVPTSIKGGQTTKDLMKNFYLSNGFTLFGKAFAAHDATRLSLSSMVALGSAPGGENVKATDQKRGTWGVAYTIQENPYFELLRKSGYQLNIFQNDFLNFCGPSFNSVEKCVTVPCCSIGILAQLPMSALRKMRIQASTFLELFVSYKAIRKAYRYLDHVGLPLPYWDWERQFATIAGYNVLNLLKSEIPSAANGNFYFAHALIPHSPYVYDRACNVNPPDLWLARYSEEAIEIDRWRNSRENIKNTPESRAERYQLYFGQVLCSQKFLGEIFDQLKTKGLYEDSIIIVHGDHGARLPLRAPDTSRNVPLSNQDVVDSYSTLFAIKVPKLAPGYDTRLLSIQALMENLVKGELWELPNDGRVEKRSMETLLKDSAGPGRKMVDF
jgi:hypothetical protein